MAIQNMQPQVLASLITIMILAAGCGGQNQIGPNWEAASSSDGSTSSGNDTLNANDPYSAQALSILQTNCTSCHTSTSGPANVYGLLDAQNLVNLGLLVPGQPSKSAIYQAISNGSMPPSRPLTTANQQVISNWISSLNGSTAGNGSGSSGGSTSGGGSGSTGGSTSGSGSGSTGGSNSGGGSSGGTVNTPAACVFNGQSIASGKSVVAYQSASVSAGQTCVQQTRSCSNGVLSGTYTNASCSVSGATVSFQQLKSSIFQPKCASCHSSYGTYSGLLKIVNTSKPTSSALYQYTVSGQMPRGGSALTSAQESQILAWIQDGAPNN